MSELSFLFGIKVEVFFTKLWISFKEVFNNFLKNYSIEGHVSLKLLIMPLKTGT